MDAATLAQARVSARRDLSTAQTINAPNLTYRRIAEGRHRATGSAPVVAAWPSGGQYPAGSIRTPSKGTFVTGTTLGNDKLRAEGVPFRYSSGGQVYVPGNLSMSTWVAANDFDRAWRVAFTFYGRYLDVGHYGQSGTTPRQRLWVDGVCFQPGGTPTVIPADNANHCVTYDFGTAKQYDIVIEGVGGFLGVRRAVTDWISAPSGGDGPRIAHVGDSFVHGYQGVTTALNSYGRDLAFYLGAPLLTNFGYQGTGFWDTYASDARSIYGSTERVAEIAALAPSVVIVQGTLNDGTATALQIQTGAAAWIASIRAACPTAKIIGYSPISPSAVNGVGNGGLSSDRVAAMAAAFTAAGLPWKDFSTSFTGAANVSAPDGGGNADVFRAADGIHATDDGAFALSRLIGPWIADQIWMPR